MARPSVAAENVGTRLTQISATAAQDVHGRMVVVIAGLDPQGQVWSKTVVAGVPGPWVFIGAPDA